jgi:hypothetical protein
MALPKQVQAQVDAADAMLAEANKAPEPSSLSLLPAENAEPQQQAQPQQVAEPQAAPAVPDPAPQADPFEARYKVLQGKYNAEVPALHKQVKDLEKQLTDAVQRMEQLSRQPEPQQQAPKHVVDPKDVDNFGEDLVDMVNRVASGAIRNAAQAFETKASALEEQIRKLSEQMTGVTQHTVVTAEEMFFDKLAKMVPDWEQINADERFLAWLAEADPVYGVPRQNALTHARETLNAERAAAVFRTFAGPTKAAPQPDPLDKQVSPKSTGASQPAPQEDRVISQADVNKFYDDVRRGLYRGREQEAMQIEAVINTALSEGRIR